ncbi:MAG: PAS domain S-box protein [Desulfuromonadales bacterium]
MTITAAESAGKLRRQAEEQYQSGEAMPSQPLSPEQTARVLRELQVHQIELEMQKEELSRSQAELEVAAAKLRQLSRAVEQSPVTTMITNKQGVIEFVNVKFTELTGYSAEEAVGQNPRVLKSGQTPPETYQKLWSTITAGKTWEGEFVNKRKDGSLFYEHAKISALRDDKGVITHYLAVKEDITEKRSISEQLIHAQKMESIGQMAGGLAHDLNNILTVINGYASLIQLEVKQNPEQSQYITTILSASSKAASLTRSLLAYSRKQEMHQENQDLNQLIESVGAFVKRIIHDNIEFAFSLAAEPLVAYVDTVQIEQVLLNLATNARDAMPNGGTFRITTAVGSIDESFIAGHGCGLSGRCAIISVSDTGHGMNAQTKLRVFDPFFTTKEVGRGTGLGLAMVAGIIKQHGGFVELESALGEGSVFHLYLPLIPAKAAVSAPVTAEVHREKASGTVMIIEDDELTRTMLEELLTRTGYTVIAAVDGQDAVEKFAVHKDEIQLVISDVVMPRKSGKEACDEIRRISGTMKFIFVSGHANNVIEREGDLGTDAELFIKPVLPFVLLKRIRELI